MSDRHSGEEHREKIEKLAYELKEKIEKYFLEPSDPARHEELDRIRAQIQQLGFTVRTQQSLVVDKKTGKVSCVADISVYYDGKPPQKH